MSAGGPVVLDNTVLTNFALAEAAELIAALWPVDACTTRAVRDEYQSGVRSARLPPGMWDELKVIDLLPEEEAFCANLPSGLGYGERTAIGIARSHQGVFASDDLDARRIAQRLNLPVIGTLGILMLGVKRGIVSQEQGNSALRRMIEKGYRSPVTSLDSLLETG